jgi:hypothetical protein
MNRQTKLIIFGIGGLLFFLVAVFGVSVARYEPPEVFQKYKPPANQHQNFSDIPKDCESITNGYAEMECGDGSDCFEIFYSPEELRSNCRWKQITGPSSCALLTHEDIPFFCKRIACSDSDSSDYELLTPTRDLSWYRNQCSESFLEKPFPGQNPYRFFNLTVSIVDKTENPTQGIYCRIFVQDRHSDQAFDISDKDGQCGFPALHGEKKYRFATSNSRFSEPTYWFDVDTDSFEGEEVSRRVILGSGKSPEVVSCVDSDGGMNPGAKGFLTLTLDNGTKRIAEDDCNTDTDLSERWCVNAQPQQEGIRREVCPNGCFDGACKK